MELTKFATVFTFPLQFVLIIISVCCFHSAAKSIYYHKHESHLHPNLHVWIGENRVVLVLLTWQIKLDRERIIFDLTAQTTGYVGFGLKRPPRKSTGGEDEWNDFDLVIGGIFPNGSSYLTDYHAVGNFTPIRDASQDWSLYAAYQNTTHTFLRFGRQFDTCDLRDDVPIQQGEPLQVLWALGSTDDINDDVSDWAISTSFLTILPEKSVPKMMTTMPKMNNVSHYPSWKTIVNVTIKESHAYRCTFHRGPKLSSRVHAVAIKPVLNDSRASQHVHHFTLYQCKIPRKLGHDDKDDVDVFEEFVAETEGNDCYENNNKIPVHLCMQVLYVWCPGEKGMFFPEEAGYLMTPDIQSYFMFEVHYENPGKLYNGVTFQVGVQLFYTGRLRKYNAGFLAVAHAVSDSLFIPPHSQSFRIEGRCTSNCTKRSLPRRGVDVISVMLHAHSFARKLRLRHFRQDYELPWLAAENKYDFKSQKMKHVLESRKILPGDNLVLECEYNTLSRDKVTTGGFSSTSEMCTAFLWYFPKIDEFDDCSSGFPVSILKRFLKYPQNLKTPTHHNLTSQGKAESLTFSSYVDLNVEWTPFLRNQIQEMLTLSNHRASCIIPGDFHTKSVNVAPPVFIYSDKVYKPSLPRGSQEDTKSRTRQSLKCKSKMQKWWSKDHFMSVTE